MTDADAAAEAVEIASVRLSSIVPKIRKAGVSRHYV